MPQKKKAAKQVSTTVATAVAAFLGFQFYRAIDAEAFNLRMQRKVESNHLIGQSEPQVIAVLGTPSHRAVYSNGDFTLNYFPGILVPFRKFQAHFSVEGKLRSIELMD